jgi:c(7)-type cytochrome triheme protein
LSDEVDVARNVRRPRPAALQVLAGVGSLLAVAALESACTSAQPVLAIFFDNVPAAGEEKPLVPVVRPQRRPTYKRPAPQAPVVAVADLPPEIDWAARYAELPRNDSGEVAWMRALNEKLIEPKPGIADDAKEEEPTDLDLEYVPDGQPEYKVVFPHKPHTQWMGCPSCHTDVFEMEKGKAKMTMANLGEGKYCGACHGKVAGPDLNTCPVCHIAMGK